MANCQLNEKEADQETRSQKEINNAVQATPNPHMITINKATLNINGITSPTRMQMLCNFINKHDIDILFIQEVTHPSLDNLTGYTVHYNIGTTHYGTAVVAGDYIELSNITKIPSGRAIAAEFKGIWLLNIYAPSGAAKRKEREQLFNTDLTYLLRAAPEKMILGGDFNCVLDKNDTTGHFNYSRCLAQLIQGFTLRDAWANNPAVQAYAHYSNTGASRLDRIYISHTIYGKKKPA
jgi:endonuclease/exonuclease/phosphatase family metal-dependent hydrolase